MPHFVFAPLKGALPIHCSLNVNCSMTSFSQLTTICCGTGNLHDLLKIFVSVIPKLEVNTTTVHLARCEKCSSKQPPRPGTNPPASPACPYVHQTHLKCWPPLATWPQRGSGCPKPFVPLQPTFPLNPSNQSLPVDSKCLICPQSPQIGQSVWGRWLTSTMFNNALFPYKGLKTDRDMQRPGGQVRKMSFR